MVSQRVPGLADRRVVLVEHFAIREDESNVVDKLVSGLVHRRNLVQLLLDCSEVHRCLDDLLVRWKLL